MTVDVLWIFTHLTGHGRHQLAILAGFAASERIKLKTTKKRWKHLFSNHKSMSGKIWPKFARCYACPENLQI